MVTIITFVFIIGYFIIATESYFEINKAAVALVCGVLCWTTYILLNNQGPHVVNEQLAEHFSSISQILFFLMAAMTIVELIDAHDGFEIVTSAIHTRNKAKLFVIISVLTFFMSALLDNLTTAIVMVSLVKKLVDDKKDRFLFCGMIVISANAGGAWSPIGDVTTTMLWIGGQISALNVIKELFIPSLVCMVLPMLLLMSKLKGDFVASTISKPKLTSTHFERSFVFYTGIGGLLCVPIFKVTTNLPPSMGILLALGVLWMLIEIVHRKKNSEIKNAYSVARALQRIDVPSILFFLGILMAIAALESTGMLKNISLWMENYFKNTYLIVFLIGLLSAIVDNVPLVAASMGMYDIQVYPTDSPIWEFLAFSTGTGGSILIIGSAAGIAAMGIEKIDFIEYLKKFSLYALIGYIAGALTYLLIEGVI